jgi:hypothetical protein
MSAIVRDIPAPSPDSPYQYAPPEFEFPFLNLGDSEAFILTRFFKQTVAGWTADRLAARYIPGRDADAQYPNAYLIAESKISRTETAMCQFTRTYARIPGQQIIPSSMFITKPDIPGEFPQNFGDYLITKPVSTVSSYNAYVRKTVSSDSGAVTGAYPSGGTYTLTFGGDTTTNIAYNASNSTVQSALNALTSVGNRGNCVVTGSYNSVAGLTVTFNSYALASVDMSSVTNTFSSAYNDGRSSANGGYTQVMSYGFYSSGVIDGGTFTVTIFGQTTGSIAYNASAATVQTALNLLSEVTDRGGCTVATGGSTINYDPRRLAFTINFTNAIITADASSLTPSGAYITPTITDGTVGRTQSITFVGSGASRTLNVSGGHGIDSSSSIYIKADSVYYELASSAFNVTDSSTVALIATLDLAYSAAVAITEVGPLFKSAYSPSVTLSRIKRVTDYYLPGVSPGISSSDEIPLPTYQGDAASLLAAIFSGSTSINYEVGELTRWLDSPILARTLTTLNAATLT